MQFKKTGIIVSHQNIASKKSTPLLNQIPGSYRVGALVDVAIHISKGPKCIIARGVKSKTSENQDYEEHFEYAFEKKWFTKLSGLNEIIATRAAGEEHLNEKKMEPTRRKHRSTGKKAGRPKTEKNRMCLICRKSYSTKHYAEHASRPKHLSALSLLIEKLKKL